MPVYKGMCLNFSIGSAFWDDVLKVCIVWKQYPSSLFLMEMPLMVQEWEKRWCCSPQSCTLIIKVLKKISDCICRFEDRGGNWALHYWLFFMEILNRFLTFSSQMKSCAFISLIISPPVVSYTFKNGLLLVNVVLEECWHSGYNPVFFNDWPAT